MILFVVVEIIVAVFALGAFAWVLYWPQKFGRTDGTKTRGVDILKKASK